MINFDVKNFTLDKNYVIEASAGTGKTYNIVEIVNKLVNECKYKHLCKGKCKAKCENTCEETCPYVEKQDIHKILIVT